MKTRSNLSSPQAVRLSFCILVRELSKYFSSLTFVPAPFDYCPNARYLYFPYNLYIWHFIRSGYLKSCSYYEDGEKFYLLVPDCVSSNSIVKNFYHSEL